MQEIIEIMAAQMVPVIVAILATLVSVGMVQLNRWLKLKTGSEAVAAAGEIVAATVNQLAATTVKTFKTASADGKLTLVDARTIKNQAIFQVKSQIPATVAKAACAAIGDLDAFISGKIEQAVTEIKGQQPASGNL